MQLSTSFTISLLNNLQDDIQVVLDASIPNKAQNRAASKMAGSYFLNARQVVVDKFSNIDPSEIIGLIDVYRNADGDPDVVLR